MSSFAHPVFIFVLGALILPLLRPRRVRQGLQLIIPALAFVSLCYLPHGEHWTYRFLGYELILGRIDKLSLCFAYVFVLVTFLGMVYALHVKEEGQHVAALLYAGAALGVTFAGDLLTLFLFWELMAISSVFLIWYRRSKAALEAGFRYIMVHLFGGALLLAGILIHLSQTGSILFNTMQFGSLSSYLILIGFLINAAAVPLHAWLPDAYPEATITGSVFLTAYTTKSAVYVLLRGYPGVELLVWVGAAMAIYGVVYAILENDIRRLLAYHIVSQVGYMVCGVGLGTELSMNGSAAHAFSHIVYKALLFMGAGAVIHATGKRKMTDLQGRGLFRAMPLCLIFYLIGGFSISGAPLLNGFTSKPMIVLAASEINRPVVHLLLHLASIGTFLSTTLKLPYGTWFGKAPRTKTTDKIEVKKVPLNMLVAMGMAGFVCVLTGVCPWLLYDILPYAVHFKPYTWYTVLSTVQLLMFTGLAFSIFIKHMSPKPLISLDTDIFYRKGAELFIRFCLGFLGLRAAVQESAAAFVRSAARWSQNPIQTVISVALSKGKRVSPYDPNVHRHAIGIGVMFFLVLFSLFCLVLLAS